VIPTPFRHENVDEIDVLALEKVIEQMASKKVHGLWVLGVGGEQDTLSDTEREIVLRTSLSGCAGLPVSAGVTSTRAAESLERARRFQELGCKSIFALQPVTSQSDGESVASFYQQLVDTGIETVAYIDTTPWEKQGCGVNAIISQLDPLWELSIAGVKLACSDFRIWVALNDRALRHGLLVYTASGRLAVAALALGAHGVIADDVTVAPDRFVELFEAWRKGDHATARELQYQVAEIGRLISEVSISGAKYALARQGLCAPDTRQPTAVDSNLGERIAAELNALR